MTVEDHALVISRWLNHYCAKTGLPIFTSIEHPTRVWMGIFNSRRARTGV